MLFLFLAIFLILVTLTIVEEYLGQYSKYIYIGMGVVFVLYSGFREVGMDLDSENYQYRFFNLQQDILDTIELSYEVLCNILRPIFDDVHSIFLLYAMLGVGIKMFAVTRLTNLYFAPLVIYFGNYYILHDMTQIRAGVASAFLLLSLRPLAEGKRWQAFACYVGAFVFHYSSIVMMPLLLLNNKPMTNRMRIILASAFPVSLVVYVLNIDFVTLIPVPFLQEKMDIYQAMKDLGVMGDKTNIINIVYLTRVLIFYFLLYFYEPIKEHNKYISLMLKVMTLMVVALPMLSQMPVFAFRLSEMFGIVEIVLFCMIAYTVKQQYIAKAAIIIIGLVSMYYNAFYNELLDFNV